MNIRKDGFPPNTNSQTLEKECCTPRQSNSTEIKIKDTYGSKPDT
jgi:hypothetical protein